MGAIKVFATALVYLVAATGVVLAAQSVLKAPATPTGQGIMVSEVIGANVESGQETIGTVYELIMGREGRVNKAVLSVGGVLGVGSTLVAIPFKELSIGQQRLQNADGSTGAPAGILVNYSGSLEQLQQLPEFTPAGAATGGTDQSGGTTPQDGDQNQNETRNQ